MLYSKANLAVAKVASGNQYDGPLCGVGLEADGSTVAGNGRVFMAVGPADRGVYFPEVGPMAEPGEGRVIPTDLATDAAKLIPRDKQVSLNHVALTEARDGAKIEFTSVDRAGRERRVAGLPKRERYPDWRGIAKSVTGGHTVKVAVSRRDLLALLAAVDEAAGDDPDGVLVVEIGDGLLLRARARLTRQSIVGIAAARKLEADAIKPDAWEAAWAQGQGRRIWKREAK